MNEVRRWYDGYNFLGDHVYNPGEILYSVGLALAPEVLADVLSQELKKIPLIESFFSKFFITANITSECPFVYS